MRTTVLVPTWRRAEDLRRCLGALAAQSHPPDEVLVVVRRDDAETWSLLRSPAADGAVTASAVTVDEPGVVASVNAGLDAASGDVVAITDDDAVPRPDWLARIVETLAGRPDAGGVGGRDWVHQEGAVLDGHAQRVGELRWFGRLVGDHHVGAGAPREVDVLKGVNMAFRRAALDGARISTALRGRGAQAHWEIDLCLAVRRRGWTLVYDPAIAVDHFPAPRPDAPRRGRLAGPALADEVFNQTYGLLRGVPGGSKPVVFAYGLLAGTRQAPGPLCAVLEALRGRPVTGALRASGTARVEALVVYLRERAHAGTRGRLPAGLRSLAGVLPPAARRVLRRRRVHRQIRTFAPRVVQHRFGGHLLRVMLRDPLGEGWYDHDWGPQPEIEQLRTGRLVPGARVFDAGAHQGVVALMLAREVGEHGHVVAVEAEPHNARVAVENRELNAAANLTVVAAAVSDQPGRIFFSEGLNGTVQPGGRAGKVAVDATTIDALADRFGHPDVVFVDVEGFEERALRGARGTLARGMTDFFVELHDRETLARAGASAERVVAMLVDAGCDCRVAVTHDGTVSGAFTGLDAGLHLRGERCYLVAIAPRRRAPG